MIQHKYVITSLLDNPYEEGIIVDFIIGSDKTYLFYLDKTTDEVKVNFYYMKILNGEMIKDCNRIAKHVDRKEFLKVLDKISMII